MALSGKTFGAKFGSIRARAAARAEVPAAPDHNTPPLPVHLIAPSPRELRAQAVHRLQVGMFGLAGMLLLVSLANVIMERAQQSDPAGSAGAAAAIASASPANDPLVDMGVAPELPVGGGPAKAPKPAHSRTP